MKDQINTIRSELTSLHGIVGDLSEALTALTQLEAMAGDQEPVAWCPALTYPGHEKDRAWANGKPRKEDIEYWTLNGKGITYAYAAPVAQQYEAGDVASAAAQGFRDGVASVAQPQEPVAYYYQKHNCFGQLVWNVGFVAPGDATHCYPLYTAAPVAQQPQAEPFQPDWVNYRQGLHDGWAEGYEQGIADERTSEASIGIAGFGAKVNPARENPYKTQPQPQAEAVPAIYVSRGQLENLKPDPEDAAGTYLPVRKTPKGKFTYPLFSAPQQAEAVPPSNLIDPGSVVSFAVDRWLAEVSNRPLVNKNRRTLDDTWRQVIRRFGGDPDVLLGPPHDELAAIAQQKGGV